ncbi:MAG: glycosyltransferase [Blautia sp.]
MRNKKKNTGKFTVSVIIPVYKPDKKFPELLKMLEKQTYSFEKLIIMNTERQYWKEEWNGLASGMEVHHIQREEFDHGGTRAQAARMCTSQILVYFTQDAVPADVYVIENLIKAFEDPKTGAAYARQLPAEDCQIAERYTRTFNYPDTGRVKSKEDLPELGIKTFFCSNVCAAYRRDLYEKLGGFITHTIFNEDMIFAGNLVLAGYSVAYQADARVIHSHNYGNMQQFRRNFDLAVSQADHPEIFEGIRSESEGIRLVKNTILHLWKIHKPWLIPGMIIKSGFKFMGYRAGKAYKRLPRKVVLWCTMNPSYWTDGK